MHDMSGWSWGFGLGHWVPGAIVWLLVLVGLAAIVKFVFTSRR